MYKFMKKENSEEVKPEEKKKTNYSKQGKLNRAAGQRFEAKVRAGLEQMGWIVAKWPNTIDYNREGNTGKVVPAKRKYNPFKKVMVLGTGFPDFVAFRTNNWKYNKANSELPLMKGFCENCKKESFNHEITKGIINCDFCNEPIASIPLGKEEELKQNQTEIIGIEVKSKGYLDAIERDMCRWLLENRIFSRILIAKKGDKRGKIEYTDFYEKYSPAQ
jgi:hypothetical protein